jgi:hypothetical protein
MFHVTPPKGSVLQVMTLQALALRAARRISQS